MKKILLTITIMFVAGCGFDMPLPPAMGQEPRPMCQWMMGDTPIEMPCDMQDRAVICIGTQPCPVTVNIYECSTDAP